MGFFGIGSTKPKAEEGPSKSERFNAIFATVPADGQGSMSESYSGNGSHPLDNVKKDIRDMPDQSSIKEDLVALDSHHGLEHARSKTVERVEENHYPDRAPRNVPESDKAEKFNSLFGSVSADQRDGRTTGMDSDGVLDKVAEDMSKMPSTYNPELVAMDRRQVMDKNASTGVTVAKDNSAEIGRQMDADIRKEKFNNLFGHVSVDGHSGNMVNYSTHHDAKADISSMPGQDSINEELVALDSKRGIDHARPTYAPSAYPTYPERAAENAKRMGDGVSEKAENFNTLFGTVSADQRDGRTTGMTSDGVLDKVAEDMSKMPAHFNEDLVKNENAKAKPTYADSDYPTYPERAAEYAKRMGDGVNEKAENFNTLFGSVSADQRDGRTTGMTSDGVLDNVAEDMSKMPSTYNQDLVAMDRHQVMDKAASTGVVVAAKGQEVDEASAARHDKFNTLFGDVPVDGRNSGVV